MFNPLLNLIPLSGFLALLISFWMSLQLTRELLEKLDDVEAVTISAVNTSRECGKEVANKTVIAMGLKRSVELLINQIENINEENDASLMNVMTNSVNTTKMYPLYKTHIASSTVKNMEHVNIAKVEPVKIPKKQKIRQNRLQMYGVIITSIKYRMFILKYSKIHTFKILE